ncbi:hypothetical protein DENSPDRAFT_837406 [Dentipellis sp. KUC8613]|nr:hypothetical protein DENSPDRAFT_837406 [Dentipellis sp. KUC8613]
MLVLSTLHKLLSKVLSPPQLHTAVLFTPSGQLVSSASSPTRSKDDIRVIVGVGSEVWQEIDAQGMGMAESELGRILVLRVEDPAPSSADPAAPAENGDEEKPREEALMLVALNATEDMDWGDLQAKGKELVAHLSRPIGKLREPLKTSSVSPTPPPPSRLPR